MAVLNLRDVPDELAAKLKSEAALVGISLREYCVGILGCAMAMANKKWPWAGYGVSGAELVGSKKIAEVSVGGGTTEGGGDPSLPPMGKAQDWELSGSTVESHPAEPDNIVYYGRAGVAPDFNEVHVPTQAHALWRKEFADGLAAVRKVMLADGVPCDHAGCLSHVSHPCEGCGRIGGRRPIYNMEDNEARGKFLLTADELKKIADESPGGFLTLSPEVLAVLRERAAVDGETAKVLHQDGLPLDREILVRWGLAENYKPKMESVDGTRDYSERRGKENEDRGVDGGNPAALAKSNDGGKSGAVATGKPKVNMAALRDICAGKTIQQVFSDIQHREPVEVDLCGFKSYNEIDGEYYVCGKEVHGPKVNHGEWIKV
jgi:hypothetical protein